MIYNTYGSTGIKVSAVGFGGMRFENPKDIDASAALLKSAYDKGINYFDTAPGYCNDKSEEIYGSALKEMQKTRSQKPFYVATKTFSGEPENVRKDIEKSLKRLGLDYIDFYYFWCIVELDEYHRRKNNGVLKEFEKLKDEGLIKHICVSTHLPGEQIGQMLADYPFEGVLLGYSAMNFAYRDAGLYAASKLKQGVVVMNPLGGGLIPQNPKVFSFVKTREDETVTQGALKFLLNDKRINVSLVGFSSKEQIKEAVAAVDGYKPIPPKTVEKIRSRIKESFNQLCTGCQYCDKCPEGIPVPRMMDTYNHKMFSGKDASVIDRFYWHWRIDLENNYLDKCTQCGICEAACTQRLPIRDRLKEMREIVDKHIAQKKKENKPPNEP